MLFEESPQALFLMKNWMKEDKIMKCKMFDNANAMKSTSMGLPLHGFLFVKTTAPFCVDLIN